MSSEAQIQAMHTQQEPQTAQTTQMADICPVPDCGKKAKRMCNHLFPTQRKQCLRLQLTVLMGQLKIMTK